MKKTTLTIFSFVIALQFVFAGGIVTNTNQSATWVRSMARDASVDVDAVFFNPAGLTHLEDGFYIQINSQTVTQSRTVTSSFPTLNDGTYEGTTFVPVLPTGFLAWKKGNLAVSAGFTVIGGGGSAEFERGLPEFEQTISTLVPSMNQLAEGLGQPALAVTGYSADINFAGTSAYYGIQAGVSYKVSDVLSVGLGGRYIIANNSYTGHIKDISLQMANGSILAKDYINNLALPTVNGALGQIEGGLVQLNDGVTTLTGYSDLIGGFLEAIPGSELLPVNTALLLAVGGGMIDQATADQVAAFLAASGIDGSTTTLGDMNNVLTGQITGLEGQITTLNGQKAELTGTALALQGTAAIVGDNEVNVTQSGTGFTPIVSVDLSFMEGDLGLAIKYEHKTSMKITTKVTQDDTGLYIDGEDVEANMPGMISAGVRYNATDKFRTQVGFHYYLDMGAKYGKKADGPDGFRKGDFVTNGEEATIDGVTQSYMNSNAYEAAIGLEYDVHKMATLSGGFLYTASDPNSIYQSGLSYSLNTMTFGVGASLHLMDNFDLDLAYSNTSYDIYTKELDGGVFGAYEETYDKTASVFALGLTYKF